MKNVIKISALLLIATAFVVSGCSSSKKGSCGCPNKQGLVGYK